MLPPFPAWSVPVTGNRECWKSVQVGDPTPVRSDDASSIISPAYVTAAVRVTAQSELVS